MISDYENYTIRIISVDKHSRTEVLLYLNHKYEDCYFSELLKSVDSNGVITFESKIPMLELVEYGIARIEKLIAEKSVTQK